MKKNVTKEAISYLNELVLADEASAESLEKREPGYGWSPLGLLNVILARSNRKRVGVVREPGKPVRFDVMEGDKHMIDFDESDPVQFRDRHVHVDIPAELVQALASRVSTEVINRIDPDKRLHRYKIEVAKSLAGCRFVFLSEGQLKLANELRLEGYLQESVLRTNGNADSFWCVGGTTAHCYSDRPPTG